MLNVTRLIPELLKKLDEGKFGFTPAAELALLCKEEQFLLNDAMEYTQSAPTLSQAIRIKHIADREDLTMDHLVRILNENNKKVLKRVVFADDAIYQYFSPEESPQEIKEQILQMLREKQTKQKADEKEPASTKKRNTKSMSLLEIVQNGYERKRYLPDGTQVPRELSEEERAKKRTRQETVEMLQKRYGIANQTKREEDVSHV